MIIQSEYDSETGIKTNVHKVDNQITFEKIYDAQTLLDQCAEERALSRGKRWGETFTKVGVVPLAEVSKMMRQDGSIDSNRAFLWLKQNPKFVSFEKFLK